MFTMKYCSPIKNNGMFLFPEVGPSVKYISEEEVVEQHDYMLLCVYIHNPS